MSNQAAEHFYKQNRKDLQEESERLRNYLKIPKKKIYDLMDLIDLQLKYHQETPMSEKSIELRAVLDTLKFVIDNAKL